ncbi:MAG TPA: ABC transporter permease [Terriglobales bacterium]|nr:ABC transporter permease [Terriglobales bacterium]
MKTFWTELSFGLRLIARAPGTSAIAIVALGLGIGANTAIFSVANGLLLHPLPYSNLDRVVSVLEVAPHRPPSQTNSVSNYNYLTWRQQAHSFSEMGAFSGDEMNLGGAGTPAMVQGFLVSTNFFKILPSTPIRGRTFLPEEGQPGHDREVILSQALWQQQFNGNPAIVGQTIQLDQMAYTVVGIMGKDAVYPQTAALWMPMAITPQAQDDRSNHTLRVVATLRPNATLAEASAEMNAIAARVDARYPDTNRDWRVAVQGLAQQTVGSETYQYVLMLLVAVGFVLLIACANVANLQFARAMGRSQELAIRTALGAGRWRLIRQLLTENLLLGLGGGIFGIGFAWYSIRLILAYMPADVAQFIGGWDKISLDGTALGFTFVVAIAAGLLSGLFPAFHASRPDLNSTLKDAGRGSTTGRGRQRLRGALVVVQVSLALILLVGAGLMALGFRSLLNASNGYDPGAVLTMQMNFPGTDFYKSSVNRGIFYDQAMQRLAAIPGVVAVASAASVPLGNNYSRTRFSIEGRPPAESSAEPALLQFVSPGYFDLLHVPMVSGRDFSLSDGPSNQPVALVSRQFAAHYFPGENPIGQHIQRGSAPGNGAWLTIVGVVGDIQYDWSDRAPEPTIYFCTRQSPQQSTYFLLRGGGGRVSNFGVSARQAVAGVNREQPLFNLKTLADVIHESTIGLAYVAVMMTVAGLLALALAAIGVYGVMSYLVSERIHEFGIRMAMGASQGRILTLVMRRGAALLALGLAVGLPLAYLMAHALQSLIFGISAGDFSTFAGVSLLLAIMAAIACYIPARAATRVDPLTALRE